MVVGGGGALQLEVVPRSLPPCLPNHRGRVLDLSKTLSVGLLEEQMHLIEPTLKTWRTLKGPGTNAEKSQRKCS